MKVCFANEVHIFIKNKNGNIKKKRRLARQMREKTNTDIKRERKVSGGKRGRTHSN